MVEHALVDLGLPEVLAEVDEGNAASVAVVKRLGMTPFAVVPGVLGPMTRYRVTARRRNRPAPPRRPPRPGPCNRFAPRGPLPSHSS